MEYKINEFMTLKLENGRTFIYLDGKRWKQCYHLFFSNPNESITKEIDSIDEAAHVYDQYMKTKKKQIRIQISPEQEFWGHCSNLQAWVEMNYDTRILHSNLSFPLLKELTKLGDPKAKSIYKEEVAHRFLTGHFSTVIYLLLEDYLEIFTREEIDSLFEKINYKTLVNQKLENYPRLIRKLRKLGVKNHENYFLMEISKIINEMKNEANNKEQKGNLGCISLEKMDLPLIAKHPQSYLLLESLIELIGVERMVIIEKQTGVLDQFLSPIAKEFYLQISSTLQRIVQIRPYVSGHDTKPPGVGIENKKIVYLDLSNCGLKRIPKGMLNQNHLRGLNLAYNEIQSVPEQLYELKKLETLNLSGNAIKSLSESLYKLIHVQKFEIDSNNLNQETREIIRRFAKKREKLLEIYTSTTGKKGAWRGKYTVDFKKWKEQNPEIIEMIARENNLG